MTRQPAKNVPQPFLPFYEVLEPLGEGAVATVYKVRTRKDGSIRALKALKPEHAGTTRGVERFEDEYRILSTLHHPSLPRVFDYGIAGDGRRYMVMEILEGQPLDQYVASNKGDLWLLLFQLNEAIAFIHEHDLLHLDLKPDNVLVRRTRAFGDDEMPLVMLIDFGLSYRRESGGKVKLVGTPGYMAPEVIRGEEELTRAADYYSTGVIIYELVEGRLPFEGNMQDVLRAHLTKRVTFAQRRVEYAELYPWIEKLMSKEPTERLAAFQEFRRLMAARQDEAIAELQRAYALGYIDSLGLVGKEEVWEELGAWASRVRDGLDARTNAVAALSRAPADVDSSEAASAVELGDVTEGKSSDTPPQILQASITDFDTKIREDLIKSAAAAMESQPPAEPGPIDDVSRLVNLSGPPDCGKTYLLDAFKHELKLKGLNAVALGEDSDYKSLVDLESGAADRAGTESVDPGSIAIDRFVTGWNRLCELGKQGGVVLRVDDSEHLNREEREFVEYVGKRLGMALAEDAEPGVFVVAVGKRADVENALPSLTSGGLEFVSAEVPPPSKADADAITETFRGRLSGRREREALGIFLKANLGTGGALYSALRRCVADGNLHYEGGAWRFTEPRGEAVVEKDAAGEYYRGLVKDLKSGPKELLPWLVCHPAPLSMKELVGVSGLGESEIDEAIEVLKPYRMIEIVDTDRGPRVDIVNDQVRAGLYEAFPAKVMRRVHRKYIEYLTGQPDDAVTYFELLAYHNQLVGDVRPALIARIQALQRARAAKDVFALRRLCEEGVGYVRKLRSKEWKSRRWHIERYFLKRWVDAEWMATNFGGLVAVIDRQFHRRGQEVPLSFFYKYTTALEKSGDFAGCRKVIDEGKARIVSKTSETYYHLLLEEANLVFRVESDRDSCHILDRIDVDSLSPYYQARVYVTYVLNYARLGKQEEFSAYTKKASEISTRYGYIEHQLRLNYEEGDSLMSKSLYDEAKTILRKSIQLAQYHRDYRGLAMSCFLASAVYYEEGRYQRALNFLDKAINVSKQNGYEEQVNEFRLRYAMIHQNLGYYGNAIRFASSVVNSVRSRSDHEQYFYAVLLMFELFMCINSSNTARYKDELDELVGAIREPYRLGLYHRLIGVYCCQNSEYSDAWTECEKARKIYERLGFEDDVARVEFTMVMVLFGQDKLDEACLLLEKVGKRIKKMQSSDIIAEFRLLRLEYFIRSRLNSGVVLDGLERCEEIRSDVRDANIALRLDAGLFKGRQVMGDYRRAVLHFRSYYEGIKTVVGNLPKTEYVNDYLNKAEFVSIVDSYKNLKNKRPGRS